MTTHGRESTESTGFLYPFIESEETDASSLLDDLSASARGKAAESARLQRESLDEYGPALTTAGIEMAERNGQRPRGHPGDALRRGPILPGPLGVLLRAFRVPLRRANQPAPGIGAGIFGIARQRLLKVVRGQVQRADRERDAIGHAAVRTMRRPSGAPRGNTSRPN